MAILNNPEDFVSGENITAAKLNNLVDGATFLGGAGQATDDSTLEVNDGVGGDGSLRVKDLGITTAKIADASVTEAKLANGAITSGKISTTDTNFNVQSDGKVGIGTASPTQKLDVRGFVNIENTTGDSLLSIVSGGSDAHSILDLGDQANSSVGRIQYEHQNDILQFYTSHVVGVTSTQMTLNTSGLDVSGDVSSNGVVLTSDDRVKHNEEVVTNAVSVIKQLVAKKYFKTKELYEANHDFTLDSNGNPVDENGQAIDCKVEVGVIAQDVANIPELAFAVSSDEVNENGEVVKPHGLDYNSLFTYAVAAIKEQQAIIEDLKARVEALEA